MNSYDSCFVIYLCPHCKSSISIIGDPAPYEKMLAAYLSKKPCCPVCKNLLV